MSLHIDSQGSGAALLLIHGWGMHSGMWGQVAEQLARSYRVHRVDLPGHGYSKLPSPVHGRGAGGEGADQDTLSLTLSRKREREQVLLDEIVAQISAQCAEPLTVVGWSLGKDLATDLPLRALQMALGQRTPARLHHSDRGCQYASTAYQSALRHRGIECSMSRRGDCWDNAPVESFFATLKRELVHRSAWSTRAEARLDIFDYIEVFYNQTRRHSALDYLSPAVFEEQLIAA